MAMGRIEGPEEEKVGRREEEGEIDEDPVGDVEVFRDREEGDVAPENDGKAIATRQRKEDHRGQKEIGRDEFYSMAAITFLEEGRGGKDEEDPELDPEKREAERIWIEVHFPASEDVAGDPLDEERGKGEGEEG